MFAYGPWLWGFALCLSVSAGGCHFKQGDMNSGYQFVVLLPWWSCVLWRLTFFGISCVAGCGHAGFGPWQALVGLVVGIALCGGIH